jgi:ABC-type transport system involved in multi-copper enzyme maturation permease subunit
MPPEAVAAAPSRPARGTRELFDALLDRTNPIVIKDVRAALRSRAFAAVFGLALLGTIAVALLVLLRGFGGGGTEDVGRQLTFGVGLAAFVALDGFVPFTAFQSTCDELDERAIEGVLLSRLTPWQIVSGKLCTALLLGALIACATLPTLSIAWAFGGVDPMLLAIGGAAAAAACAFGASVAILFGSFANTTPRRMLFGAALALVVFPTALVAWSASLFATEGGLGPGVSACCCGTVVGLPAGLLALAMATGRFQDYALPQVRSIHTWEPQAPAKAAEHGT